MLKTYYDKILIGSIALLLFLIAYFSTPYTDDFCMDYIRHLNKNILSIVKERYIVKEGRFVSLPGLFQIAGFRYLNFNMLSVIWVSFYLGIAYLLSKVYYNKNTINKYGRILLVLILLLIGSEKVINDVVFWATGGSYYSVATFLMLLSFYFIWKYGFKHMLLLSPFLITIGPNYSLPILFVLLVELFNNSTIQLRKKAAWSILFILVFTFGIFILIKSPGTQARLNTVSTFWMWHPRYIIEAVYKIFYSAFSFYYLASLMAILFLAKSIKDVLKSGKALLLMLWQLIYDLRFFWAAMGSVLVFVRTPGLFSERAGYAFFILSLIQFVYTFRSFVISNSIIKAMKICAFIVAIVLSHTLLKVINFNNEYNSDVKEFEKIDKSVFEEKYLYNTVNLPFKRFEKIEKKQNIWIEQCFENYYYKSLEKN